MEHLLYVKDAGQTAGMISGRGIAPFLWNCVVLPEHVIEIPAE